MMVFIDVLLTLLLPATFGSFTAYIISGFREVMMFLLMDAIFFEAGGRFIWMGAFVLLFLVFLLSFYLIKSVFVFYYFAFYAKRRATALAIFLIC